ncbi:unnamed protein product, partial [Rotaria sordida]
MTSTVFFEIFDYLDALEIFTAFTSLNQRISSILKRIPLRILISNTNSRSEIEFLSSHLTYHDHQVISIDIYDKIRDCSSVINLLFNRHNFINLESCIFNAINSSTKLKKILKKLKSLNRLVSFGIYQADDLGINDKDKYELSQMVFMNQLSSLRSVVLNYTYDYMNISNYPSITTNLISLALCISGLSSTVSIYSMFLILRHCHKIRYLTILIAYIDACENEKASDRFRIPHINPNDLPLLPQVIYLNLIVIVRCDNRSISHILRCMPNLIYFYFTLGIPTANWPLPDELRNGYVWQEMIDRYIPHLLKFEFLIGIKKSYQHLDLDMIVNSFEYFVGKYPNWNMIITQWKHHKEIGGEYLILHTFNYRQNRYTTNITIPIVNCETFQVRSTSIQNDQHLFYSIIEDLCLYLTDQQATITWSSPLFQQVKSLAIEMPIISASWWNNLLNIANYGVVNDDKDKLKIIPYLKHFVDLHKITEIKFLKMSHISRWMDVQLILQTCPNVIDLSISTELLLLSKIIDNRSLFPVFERIKKIELIKNIVYFLPSSASKIVERFPSLNNIKLTVFTRLFEK